jgi:hypothetical protein
MEDSRRVGTYLDAGADLAQFGCLLEHLDLEARASKRQRRSQPADSGADDYDSHVRSPAIVTGRLKIMAPPLSGGRDPSLRRLRSG